MVSTIKSKVVASARCIVFRITERVNDWRLGIVTDAMITRPDVATNDPECHNYSATSYKRFAEVMRHVDLRPGQDVFLDYGSGMGRALILAAHYPFHKVIGVEMSPQLNRIAQRNINAVSKRVRCRPIELHTCDARAFPVPHDVSVVYFWSPFSSDILKSVLENLKRSLALAPRTMTVLYAFPPGLSCLDALRSELPWLHIGADITLGSGMTLNVCHIQ